MYLATVLGLKGVLLHLENTINNVTKILLMLLKLSQAATKFYFKAKKFDIWREEETREAGRHLRNQTHHRPSSWRRQRRRRRRRQRWGRRWRQRRCRRSFGRHCPARKERQRPDSVHKIVKLLIKNARLVVGWSTLSAKVEGSNPTFDLKMNCRCYLNWNCSWRTGFNQCSRAGHKSEQHSQTKKLRSW